jgi:hypothetical protein
VQHGDLLEIAPRMPGGWGGGGRSLAGKVQRASQHAQVSVSVAAVACSVAALLQQHASQIAQAVVFVQNFGTRARTNFFFWNVIILY